ncbi:uncharacterized protein LOC110462542 [Mizuhopecten yessoensis]|uniref:Tox-ART-HYD1 domain-containing protein n=1 Tax=Mizuhopecten yessoensis TaxID=6573 RepID=A0A210PY35_MIZYE|nr:uncharacterized protein LOC110462542 [Mizuhopecten yessoensis]OWF41396.1 hypothetical protein KP79_PYT08417 [Mizuhopecten yessoensis]
MADNKEETIRVYHHTNKEGAEGILQSGYIAPSTDTTTDARYGPGAYMTSYGPEKSQDEIARNNYDGYQDTLANQMVKAGKTDAIIAIDIPKSQVTKADSDRDIYVAEGNVTLADKNPSVYVRDKSGKANVYKPKK